jgi:hypothetical protein
MSTTLQNSYVFVRGNSKRRVMEAEVPESELVDSLLTAARPPSSAARSGMCTPTSRRWSPSSAARASASVLYHKHGTFLHRALCLWGASDAVTWCSLFHSYSNSYVNLAIFDPGTNGPRLCALRRRRGRRAAFVHLLCVVPRKALMHDH